MGMSKKVRKFGEEQEEGGVSACVLVQLCLGRSAPAHEVPHELNSTTAMESVFGHEYHCDVCEKDLTFIVRIRCAVCPDVDLCVECFSTGAEKGEHKNDHPYRVIDILNFPLFDEEWRADEEITFIEGLEKYGTGNWEEIAEHVATKNKVECSEHYHKVYIDSDNFPTPDMDKTFDPNIRLPIKMMQRLPKTARPPSSVPVNHEIAGYMPARGEFETEYENDAEQQVKDLEFFEDDSPGDIKLKSAMLSVYNSILDRRKERKELVFDRQLTDYRKNKAAETKWPKEKRELLQKLRVFARLQTAMDFSMLANDMWGMRHFSQAGMTVMGSLNFEITEEMLLRKRISELQEWRRMGLTSKAETVEYEREKAARYSGRHGGARSSARFTPYGDGSGPSSRASTPSRLGGPSLLPTASLSAAASPMPTYTPFATPSLTRTPTAPTYGTPIPTPQQQQQQIRKGPAPIDVSNEEGVELLIPSERELCNNLRILPKAYLAIKDQLLKEYVAKGSLRRRQARQLIKMDVNKTSRLYDFFVEVGWIKLKGIELK
ncbi:Transcriptional adapter ada2 [Rhizophlyctis rosea]|nr:Transcriptional adapter ada2 [Rhizophlyctis rosea]